MISVFRRLRNRLVSGDSMSRYLAYAIGEIFLVVIGILIALQVNNWNQVRLSRINLNNDLEKMVLDLKSDSIFFEFCINSYQENYKLGKKLWNQLYHDSLPPKTGQFIFETQGIARTIIFEKNDNQFSAMDGNNSLKLIADDSLRNIIVNYYTNHHMTDLLELLQERNLKFHEMVVDAIPMEAHEFILKRDSIGYMNWVTQNPNSNHEILNKLQPKEDLPLALKNSIRSYLLALNQLDRNFERNKELVQKIKVYLKEY